MRCLLSFAVALTLVQARSGDPKAAALEKLQGRWSLVAPVTFDGQPQDVPPGTEILIEGDRLTVSLNDRKTIFAPFTIEIDPSKSPATIDLVTSGGARALGIYRLDGDTLTMCNSSAADRPRPEGFRSDPGRKEGLMTYRRIGR